MEFVQERITTLHNLTGDVPSVDLDNVAVVIPMTERDYATLATEQMLSVLESVEPATVLIALRAGRNQIPSYHDWLTDFDLPLEIVWCNGDAVSELLDRHEFDGNTGKGRDMWLAIGIAANDHRFVVCHDADTESYSSTDVERLLYPLTRGFTFSKGYYARVEDNQLYGRLFRLLYSPLVQALFTLYPAEPLVQYLGSFRYALAGEFAATASLIRQLPFERRFGLEVGTLGGAFTHAGFENTAQVDLGEYRHDHRAVGGPTGLADMSEEIVAAMFRILTDDGISLDYETIREEYLAAGSRIVEHYAEDSAYNGLQYDLDDERQQIATYADAIGSPGPDDRLPPWASLSLDPSVVKDRAITDLTAIVS